jgi:uncharacterized membrane protein
MTNLQHNIANWIMLITALISLIAPYMTKDEDSRLAIRSLTTSFLMGLCAMYLVFVV